VCLVERGGTKAPVGESLGPAITPLLKELGVFDDIQHAGFIRCEGTQLHWSAAGEQLQPGRAAVIVERRRFDRMLLDAAWRTGTVVLSEARARAPARHLAGWSVPVETRKGPVSIEASFLVDARGKRAALPANGAATAALCGRFREVELSGAPHMRVEACRDAWLWGAPLPDGSFAVVAFVATDKCLGIGSAERTRLYRALLAQSELFQACHAGVMIGDVVVRDATPRRDDDPVGGNVIKVGDRALSLDPVSSQGVQSALRSGLQAAAVVHTILSGGDAGAALEFYRNTQREAARLHGRLTREVYATQTLHDAPFWRARATAADTPRPQEADAVVSPAQTQLRLSADARILPMPVIEGDVISRRAALLHPGLEQPIAWLDGIELAAALAMIDAPRRAADILSDWSGQMRPDSAERLLGWMIRRGILVGA